MDQLILKRAPIARNDFDVVADGVIVGRILFVPAARCPWMWTLTYDRREDRAPTRGYEATRDDAMAAFARRWRRQ